MIKRIVLTGILLLSGYGSALSHSLSVNTFKSTNHFPNHVLCSIGWGHSVPFDDLPQQKILESYKLYDPDLETTSLPMLSDKYPDKLSIDSGLAVVSGDIGARKIILEEGCKPGTYQVGVIGKDSFYTHYLDRDNKKKWAMKPKDEVSDAKNILGGLMYKSVGVSYFTVDQWQAPRSLGCDLEILPLTDLSNVRVGDLVRFEILFRGKKLHTSPEVSVEYITAVSSTFGGPDKFALSSIIYEGKGQFRMPAAGKWLVSVFTRQEVTADNELKHLVKKCDTALFSSTVTFPVKP